MAYDLTRLAQRSRPWRTIEPPVTLGTTLAKLAYLPALAIWTSAAADMLANYGDVGAITATDEEAQREVEWLLAALALANFWQSVETWHRRKWLASVQNAAGVSVDMLLERPTGAAAVNRQARRAANRGLVASARAAVSVQAGQLAVAPALGGIDAVLANTVAVNMADVRSVSNAARARLANVIFNGLQAGRPAEDVARDVAKGLAGDRARARKSAMDQVTRASKALDRYRIEEAGFVEAEWRHSHLPLHPRPSHLARDKKVFAINDPLWAEQNWQWCRCFQTPPPLLRPGRGNVG